MNDLFQNFLTILSGLSLSLSLTVVSAIFGVILAIILTMLLSYFDRGLIRLSINSYLIFFTGTPLLVQLFLIYFGPGQFPLIQESFLWVILKEKWFCAALALILNSAAYTTQLFYGAMKAVPREQYEACQVLGMSRFETIKLIIPLALRRSLPSYSNELVLIFKSTSLVFAIALMDVMGHARYFSGQTYDSLTYYCLAGIIYLVINAIMIFALRYLERIAMRFEVDYLN
ncbi:arginine ABC transporter permease [Gammaproteobacteria bacterium]|nr:arginine ABC transporter permease [Gammaproteobacteria bacterium]